jgi:hypothetical protein
MKLTKLHIFIIILIALILCPTLGACSVEGYETSQTTFNSYGGSKGFDKFLDTSIMAGNTDYERNNNTGYSPPRNPPRMMGANNRNNNGNGSNSSNSGNGAGNGQGLLAWLKSLF